ncbi:VOC family protein [Enterococcus cecorum]|nr:VOC family protein [Enterococcus cecorum]
MDHIEIYVSDLGKSFHFYSWLFPKLGFKVFQE